MADNKAMLTKSGRRVRFTPEVLRFIAENQKMEGFSGHISAETAAHEVDMDEIAESAARFGAQIPSPTNRPPKPEIANTCPPINCPL